MGRVRRNEIDFAKQLARELNISPKEVRKRYVTRRKDMCFLDDGSF